MGGQVESPLPVLMVVQPETGEAQETDAGCTFGLEGVQALEARGQPRFQLYWCISSAQNANVTNCFLLRPSIGRQFFRML